MWNPDRYPIAHACFSRPHNQDGLALQAVQTFLQDRLGFMWVGTGRGLARFDSHGARYFHPDPDLPFSIPGKFILSLGEDQRGDIWVGTYDGGCARYDTHQERFSPVDLQPWSEHDSIVRGFASMGDGRMWIATHASLTALDLDSGSVAKFRHPEIAETPLNIPNRFTQLLPIDDRFLLAGTAVGLFLVDTLNESFRYLPYERRGLITRFGNGVVGLTRTSEGFISSTRDQLYAPDSSLERCDLIEPLFNLPGGEAYWVITSLVPDSVEGRLWIGTDNGLLRFDQHQGSYSFFKSDDANQHTPYGQDIQALAQDRSGTLWIGTGPGLSFLDLRYNFQYCRVSDAEGNLLGNNFTLVAEDERTLWVGTLQGLCEYDLTTDHLLVHSLGGNDKQQLRDNNTVREIHRGKKSWWIGTANGLFEWDPKEKRVLKHFPQQNRAEKLGTSTGVLGPQVKGIVEDRDGFVWCGSDAIGMQRYDPRNGAFHYYLKGEGYGGGIPHDTMMTSLEDSRGQLWFGFINCLARYNRLDDTFECFSHSPSDRSSLSNNMVLSLYEDHRGSIWIGTASGLNRLVEADDGSISFKRYGIREGLPADFIVSIVGHGEELWMGTNRGIVRFRERGKGVDARLYDASDGLHDSEYSLGAAMQDKVGSLCFGGGAGFDRFNPDQLRPDTTSPVVVLTDIRLFNKSVPVIPAGERTGGEFALERSITHLRELTLSYRHSVITFCYAALHYLQPEKICYEYRLEGFDTAWIDAGKKTEVTYTNLDSGEYLFHVRAINSDGLPSEYPATLIVRMEPPPWRTWWAHLLYGAAGVGAIASFTRWRIGLRERELRDQLRLEQAREEEREQLRRQNASDFHDEAGTTLTRILFLTELARRRGGDDAQLDEMLKKIDANATTLSEGMRDFIWVLDPDKDTLLDTLQRIESAGTLLFAHTDISFTMNYDHRQLQGIRLDLNRRRQALMICKESLHNALRHADANSVSVHVEQKGAWVILSVIDDGCGFDPANESSGYGLKSMGNRAESIGAKLEVKSAPEGGTEVILKIPRMGD